MSSNDKTTDLLVATTRATKAEAPADEKSKTAPAETKVSSKKTAPKKATKKAVAKKPAAKKAPTKKAPVKAKAAPQKKEVEAIVSFGQRVWPD